MDTEFYKQIEKSTAHRKSREDNRDFIYKNPDSLSELTQLAFNLKDKNHHKAWWILELIFEEKLHLITPYIDDFCEKIPQLKEDPAKRPASKICLFLSDPKIYTLTKEQETKIIETCFDWLIRDEKVAAKAYSIRTLFNFGKKYDWIHPELLQIIQQDFALHSSAYKAVAKEILKKIKH